jgi:hypothetical protein
MTAAMMMLSASVFAQTENAGIYGTVKQSGSTAISEVTVTLTGDIAGEKSTSTTTAGNFRFPALPPGTYQLKFEKQGFKTVIYKGIRMFVGQNKSLQVEMENEPADPPLFANWASGAVDVRRPAKVVNITKEMLQSLPTARNPWTIINLVPGMLLDREDVGGSESGMQSSFYGLGASGNDTTWYVDGINITHPETIGTVPAYLDTNNFEEIQVTLGANDITAQTGGTQLNFVTKKGGSRFSGGLHFYFEDDALEMKQDLPESMIDLGLGSPGIIKLYQYGVNLAGPIFRDKLWFSGSYGIQDIHARTMTQAEDTTRIPCLFGKLDFRFGKTSGGFLVFDSNRKKWERTWLPAVSQDPSTTWDQSEPFSLYAGNVRQVLGNLAVNVKAAYTESSFTLDPAGSEIDPDTGRLEGQDWLDYSLPSRYFSGSLPYYNQWKKSLNLSLDGSYFLEKFLPGDHEIRFGVDYYTANTTSQTLYPNQRKLFVYDRNNPHGYKEIWWVCNGGFDVDFERFSFYLSDTITYGRFTAGIGVRYNRETASHKAMQIPALTFNGEPIFTVYMSEIFAIEGDVWGWRRRIRHRVFSPRIALTYDVSGNGKNVVKASYARYGSFSGNSFSRLNWQLQGREIDVAWHDRNGDLVPQQGEWSDHPDDWLWWSVDKYSAFYMGPPNRFARDYNSPVLDEIAVVWEKSFGKDFAASLNAFYKRESHLIRDRGHFTVSMTGTPNGLTYAAGEVETADNWYKAGTVILPNGEEKDFYERHYVPQGIYRTNYSSGTFNTYKALQLVLSKKLSHGWMVDASFTLSGWKRHLDPDEFFDKTNFDYFNGGAVPFESGAFDYRFLDFHYHDTPAPQTFGSGLTDVYVNARWQLKIAGLVQLPFGINFTGVFNAREGYIITYYDLVNRGSGLGRTKVYEPGKKFGDDRLPAFWMLNLGIEKTFNFSSFAAATLFINGYNITNNSTTLKVNPLIGATQGQVERILNPGIFQFGVRVSF